MKQEAIRSGDFNVVASVDEIVNPEDGIRKIASDENSPVRQSKSMHNHGASAIAMTAALLLTLSVVLFSLDRPSSATTVIEHAMLLAT